MLKVLFTLSFAERNSHEHNSTFDEDAQCVLCITKSNILHNIGTEVNKANTIMPLQELLNHEENNSRVTRQRKRKLLSTDKGNNANFNIIFVSCS